MFSSASIIQQLFLTEMNLIRLIRQHIQSIQCKTQQTQTNGYPQSFTPKLSFPFSHSYFVLRFIINFLFDLVDMTPFSSTCTLSHFISENCISATFCFSEVSLIPMELSFIRCKNWTPIRICCQNEAVLWSFWTNDIS